MPDHHEGPAGAGRGSSHQEGQGIDPSYTSTAQKTQAKPNGSGEHVLLPDLAMAVQFLEKLRPGGPWLLVAIDPKGGPPKEVITARDEKEVCAFIEKHNNRHNLYYAVNPTYGPMTTKSEKGDHSAIIGIIADLDPRDDESPEDAKARYLAALEKLPPTFIIDSGNGLNGLYAFKDEIGLPQERTAEAYAVIEDVEARSRALMLALGSKAGTQNIDRILRLPGTTNLPTKAKIRAGRIACKATLLAYNDVRYTLADFPKPKAEEKETPSPQLKVDELEKVIVEGCGDRFGGDRSDAVWWVINEMLRRGYQPDKVYKTILDRDNRISDHIYDQSNPPKYAERQVNDALDALALTHPENSQTPHNTPANIRVALLILGVRVSYDMFADRILVQGLKDFGPTLDDAGVDRLWLTFDQHFKFRPQMNLLHRVLTDSARLNGFHPVLNYLNGLRWDGVERLDNWLITNAGAEDNKYTRAVGSIWMTAAVRRVRQPGCKFDEMLVLENPKQGNDKSTALSTLAIHDEWFSDSLPLNADDKKVIESVRGRWIIECGELSGMRKAEIEHVKGFLSRRRDRARMSYDRLITERPRQCVLAGTTNDDLYLKDETGNRRFWPVAIAQFDIAALTRDRDQLWAEASVREASGASIRLPEALWPAAGMEQQRRLAGDPWIDALQEALGHVEGKIAMSSVWTILGLKEGARTQEQNRRVGVALPRAGWRRPNKAGVVTIDGKSVSAYVKGEQPWREVKAKRWFEKDEGVEKLLVWAEALTSDDKAIHEAHRVAVKRKAMMARQGWPKLVEEPPSDQEFDS